MAREVHDDDVSLVGCMAVVFTVVTWAVFSFSPSTDAPFYTLLICVVAWIGFVRLFRQWRRQKNQP